MNFDFAALLAAAAPPAGGAEIGQIVIATTAATIVTAALLFLGLGHRSGRVQILQRLADHSERTSGMPGWVAFPSGIATPLGRSLGRTMAKKPALKMPKRPVRMK